MSSGFIHLIGIAGLAILAGVAGFVLGGVIEMKKHHKEMLQRRSLQVVRDQADKNSQHTSAAA